MISSVLVKKVFFSFDVNRFFQKDMKTELSEFDDAQD